MAKKLITELKEYFKAGKRPTEGQFRDLLDSYVHLDDPTVLSNNYKYVDMVIRFPNQQANMATDVLLGDRIHGDIELQIVGAYNNENTVGIIKKQIIIGGNPNGSVWNQPISRIMEASGPIVNHIYIGDIGWDSSINQYKLTIYHTRSTGNVYALRVTQHANSNVTIDTAKLSEIYANTLTGQSKHYVNYNDNVGIGTLNPRSKLQIISPFTDPYDGGTFILGDTSLPNLRMGHNGQNTWIQSHSGSPLHINPIGNPLILNKEGGNVGIGTMNPDQKLTVKGKIHAEDVIVDTNVPADYVFQKYYDNYSPIRADYQMPNLKELESYIKENRHLPEIPSGESIMKDGVKIGDFQMKLLQKIEELTLYMISQNKEIEQLKTLIN